MIRFFLYMKYWNTCQGPVHRSCFWDGIKELRSFFLVVDMFFLAVSPSFKHWNRKVFGSTSCCAFVTMLVIGCELSIVKGLLCWLINLWLIWHISAWLWIERTRDMLYVHHHCLRRKFSCFALSSLMMFHLQTVCFLREIPIIHRLILCWLILYLFLCLVHWNVLGKAW